MATGPQFASVGDYLNANKDYVSNTIPQQAQAAADAAQGAALGNVDTAFNQNAQQVANGMQGQADPRFDQAKRNYQADVDWMNANTAKSNAQGRIGSDDPTYKHYQTDMGTSGADLKKYGHEQAGYNNGWGNGNMGLNDLVANNQYKYNGPQTANFGTTDTAVGNPYASGSAFGGGGGGVLDKSLFNTNPNAINAASASFNNAQNNVNSYLNKKQNDEQTVINNRIEQARVNPYTS